jgi:hypothetical protein
MLCSIESLGYTSYMWTVVRPPAVISYLSASQDSAGRQLQHQYTGCSKIACQCMSERRTFAKVWSSECGVSLEFLIGSVWTLIGFVSLLCVNKQKGKRIFYMKRFLWPYPMLRAERREKDRKCVQVP